MSEHSIMSELKRFYSIKQQFDGIKYLWEETQFQYFLKSTLIMVIITFFMWVFYAFAILPSAEMLITIPSTLLFAQGFMIFFFNLFLIYFFLAFIKFLIFYYRRNMISIKKEPSNKPKYLLFLGKHFVLFPLIALISTILILSIPEVNLTVYSFLFITVIVILLLLTILMVPIISWASVIKTIEEYGWSYSLLFIIIIPLSSGLLIDILLNIFTLYSGIASTAFISLAIILLVFVRDILDQVGDELSENLDLTRRMLLYIFIFMGTLISISTILGLGLAGLNMHYVAEAMGQPAQDWTAGFFFGVTIFFAICQYIGMFIAFISRRS